MDAYLFFLLLGFFGLMVMAASGLGSHGHGGHQHGHHDVGDISLHGHAGGHAHAPGVNGHAAHAPAAGHAHHAGHGVKDHGADAGHSSLVGWIMQLLSPRVAFSICVGVGATGLALRPLLSPLPVAGIALAGGLAFEKLLVGPLWNFLFRFASRPAQTLESSLLESATAVTGFDSTGHGVVALEMDGQIVQILATLRAEDRAAGIRVRAGDRLVVEEVDGARNRCVVSWYGASLPASR